MLGWWSTGLGQTLAVALPILPKVRDESVQEVWNTSVFPRCSHMTHNLLTTNPFPRQGHVAAWPVETAAGRLRRLQAIQQMRVAALALTTQIVVRD